MLTKVIQVVLLIKLQDVHDPTYWHPSYILEEGASPFRLIQNDSCAGCMTTNSHMSLTLIKYLTLYT